MLLLSCSDIMSCDYMYSTIVASHVNQAKSPLKCGYVDRLLIHYVGIAFGNGMKCTKYTIYTKSVKNTLQVPWFENCVYSKTMTILFYLTPNYPCLLMVNGLNKLIPILL